MTDPGPAFLAPKGVHAGAWMVEVFPFLVLKHPCDEDLGLRHGEGSQIHVECIYIPAVGLSANPKVAFCFRCCIEEPECVHREFPREQSQFCLVSQYFHIIYAVS